MGTRAQIVEAHQRGTDAGRAGDPPTVCPYGREDILRTAWIKGYAAERRQTGKPRPE
ncbi:MULTISPECIES: Rmf/CrpP fold protein [unclassified Streptomyces]|uniref:Rmf/CrpP fold protein n=1 Tax=unclassified Streptomyces TaxID=2593676 RepID=UPI00365CEADF